MPGQQPTPLDRAVSDEVRALQARAHSLIPGGAHTYAKADDQYPTNAPPFLVRGLGCHVWDHDGNEFLEYGMGLRSVSLGHAFPPVVAAVTRALALGTNFGRPSPVEVEAAEVTLATIGRGDMVKFAKNGSDVTTAAVKLARAFTGRDLIAICRDQPFLSTDDWFIGTTLLPAGIPDPIRSLTTTFQYNDIQSLERLFDAFPNRIAGVILEPENMVAPAGNFLNDVAALCTRRGALLIFDEMITGFRWSNGGAQEVYGVTSDLATYGKALANGFALSALVGRREVMALGGLDHPAQRVFLLSTTHGAELHSLAAGLATMRFYQEHPVVEQLHSRGRRLRTGVDQAIDRNGLRGKVAILGRDSNLVFATRDAEGQPSQTFRTLFMQELVRAGILAPSFVVSYSHTEADIDRTIEAVDRTLGVYRRALDSGPERFLHGRSVRPVFR